MSIDDIRMLDISERIVLVEEIWDSIAKEQEQLGLSEYEQKILDERLFSLEQNPQDVSSWEMMKKRIRS